jgi:hypothetical protein
VYRFGDLSSSAGYKLRVMYLSHNGSRSQRLLVNDRELHGKLALPKQEIVYREFDIPANEVKNLPREAWQTKIAVDDLVVGSESPLKISMPVNGGFGVKFAGSMKEREP